MRIIYPLELRQKRRALGLTQKELAIRASVSQSLIAKIERGLLDPSFSSMVKISQALDEDVLTAADLMQKNIKWSSGDAKKDLALMKKHGLSQLVRSYNTLVSERSLLQNKEYEQVITIPPNTTKEVIQQVIESGPILVVEGEEVVGILTITDLL